MTTISINNIQKLKHFNEINNLLQIEDLEVFAKDYRVLISLIISFSIIPLSITGKS